MSNLKDIYYIVIASVFTLGLILGAILHALLTEKCKPRDILCKPDITLNNTLKGTLAKQEALCIQKIDLAVKSHSESQSQRFDLKFKRLEEACNKLDCAQCRR